MVNKNFFVVFILLILSIFSYFLLYKVNKTGDKFEKIVFGTNAEYPPFEYIENDKLMGFDIDLMEELGRRLDREIEIKDLPFDALIPTIQMGKLHAIVAGMTPTDERRKQVFFSEYYSQGDPLVILTLKENFVESLDDLNGKDVVVNEGFTADLYLSDIEGPRIKRLKNLADALLDLRTRRSFAFVTAYNAIKSVPGLREKYNLLIIKNTSDNYSIAVSKKYKDLFDEIEEALKEIKEDGTLDKLKAKWDII